MNEILAYVLGYGSIGRLFLGATVLVMLWVGIGMTQPMLMLLAILATLAAFPASSLLISASGLGVDVYGKGSGTLFFSVYEISIFMLALCLTLQARLQPLRATGALRTGGALPGNPYAICYWMLFALLVGYALAAAFDPSAHWLSAFARSGIVYTIFQGLLVSCLIVSVRDKEVLRRIGLLLAAVVGCRMLWGAFRFIFLGGDPSNFYETADNKFRITFFDVNDSILAVMLATALVWTAAANRELSQARRLVLLLSALLCLCIVALSSRRTVQIGASLAMLAVWPLLPKGRRWWIAVFLLLMLPLAVYQLGKRVDDAGLTFMQKLLIGEQRSGYFLDPRYRRSYEWEVAKRDIKSNPWLGVGPSGRFNPPSHQGLEYHQGNFGFIHSGFGHVLLKTGVVGLSLFASLFLVYTVFLIKQWKKSPTTYRAYLAASFAGIIAIIPNLISGTPLIELRTMLVMGLIIALPVMVARASHAEKYPVVAKASRTGLARQQLRSLRATWGRS